MSSGRMNADEAALAKKLAGLYAELHLLKKMGKLEQLKAELAALEAQPNTPQPIAEIAQDNPLPALNPHDVMSRLKFMTTFYANLHATTPTDNPSVTQRIQS